MLFWFVRVFFRKEKLKTKQKTTTKQNKQTKNNTKTISVTAYTDPAVNRFERFKAKRHYLNDLINFICTAAIGAEIFFFS